MTEKDPVPLGQNGGIGNLIGRFLVESLIDHVDVHVTFGQKDEPKSAQHDVLFAVFVLAGAMAVGAGIMRLFLHSCL